MAEVRIEHSPQGDKATNWQATPSHMAGLHVILGSFLETQKHSEGCPSSAGASNLRRQTHTEQPGKAIVGSSSFLHKLDYSRSGVVCLRQAFDWLRHMEGCRSVEKLR